MKTIQSPDHPLVKELAKIVSDKRARKEKGRAVVEGIKMVNELKEKAELIVAQDVSLFPDAPCEKILVTPQLLKKITALDAPEGILALLPLPERKIPKEAKRLLALDGVSDPGNVGTLLRTAFALCWEGVFLLEGCADPFNDKALRAAKGATFHLPSEEISKNELLLRLKAYKVYGADLKGKEPSPLPKEEKSLLILGSEGKGLSPSLKKGAELLSLPMRKEAESLNVAVAGGILLYILGGVNEPHSKN